MSGEDNIIYYREYTAMNDAVSIVKGAPTLGWSSFLLFLKEGSPSYQMLFTRSKILILAEVIAFLSLEFTGNYTTHANFNRDLRKTQNLVTKNLSPPSFFEIMG